MLRRKSLDYKLFFLMTVFALNTFGQDTSKINVRLKFHPLALVALSRPTVLGSVEFKIKRIGFDLAYGQQWGFMESANPDTQRVKNFGNQYRGDIKYYFKSFKNDSKTSPFISLGYCKMYTRRNLTRDWFSGYIYQPSLGIIDNIHVVYLNYGICNTFGRFFTEGVIASGVRYRTSESINSKGIVIEKASQFWPHLSISVRLGYILTNKPRK